MPHPSDHGSLSSPFDWNPLRAGHRAAPHRRGVGRHERRELCRRGSVLLVKPEKPADCRLKVFGIRGLLVFPPLGIGLPPASVGVG